jgi:hypothetical protein
LPARDLLQEVEASSPIYRHTFAIVPNDADFSSRVRIVLDTQEGRSLIYAVRSQSGRYGRPQSGDDLAGRSTTTIEEANGDHRSVDPFKLGLADDEFAVGLELRRSETRFRIASASPTGPARRVTTIATVRLAAKAANSQFKNACKVRVAPCLIMIFEDGTSAQRSIAFASAFYGDLRAEFGGGKTFFGPNGHWRRQANRTTSAACLIRNDGTPMLLHNPWASAPLPAGIFTWPSPAIDENGAINFSE